MHTTDTAPAIRCMRKLLTATLASAIGLALGSACADPVRSTAGTNRVVQNCADSGNDSLRDVVVNQAVSGDTVDLSQLTCSTITLTSGDIVMNQDDLTIVGPGADNLTIRGWGNPYNDSRIFTHFGMGTLEIDRLTVSNERARTYPANQDGACVRSSGNVYLDHAVLTNCHINTVGPSDGGAIQVDGNLAMMNSTVSNSGMTNLDADSYAYTFRGGGVAVGGDLNAVHSTISGNSIRSASEGQVLGGGAYVGGTLTVVDSAIFLNTANASQSLVQGGGIFAAGDLVMNDSKVVLNTCESALRAVGGGIWSEYAFRITGSRITNNSVSDYGAGMVSIGSHSSEERIISNSIVASNESQRTPAGLYILASWTLNNSTVAFNAAAQSAPDGDAGIRSMLGVDMQSSIISNNTAAGVSADFHGTATGADNMIFAPGASSVPGDTMVGIDPLLTAPGSGFPALMPLAGSPARNTGNNLAGLQWDVRGPGYARVSGLIADIGALEFNPPVLVLDPADVDFHGVVFGTTSAPHTVTLRNGGGTGVLHVASIETVGAPFADVGGLCPTPPFDLAAQDSCTLIYTFTPSWYGTAGEWLDIATDAGNSELVLHGVGVTSELYVTPLVNFGEVVIGESSSQREVTFQNVGNTDISLTGIESPTAPFEDFNSTCTAQLDVGASCVMLIGFEPQAIGPVTQSLTVTSSVGQVDFTLTGTGTRPDIIFADGFDP